MKLCILTGGSKGLGLALNHLYLDNDWQVKSLSRTVPDQDTAPVQNTPRSDIAETHVPCDFSQPAQAHSQIDKLFQALSQKNWQEVHLIHNAARVGAIGPLSATSDSTFTDWQATLHVNAGSVFLTTGLFLQYFQEHAALKKMTVVSSGAAQKDYAGWSLYCATKAAVERFAGCVVEEQKVFEHPVLTSIINPGVMDTDMQAHIRQADGDYFPQLERFLTLKAEDQLPSPEQVAQQCFDFLTSFHEAGARFKYS